MEASVTKEVASKAVAARISLFNMVISNEWEESKEGVVEGVLEIKREREKR
jgi:hypothetical protein